MKRVTLAALVVIAPALAAQRFEVAFLGGAYQQTPSASVGDRGINCYDSPCPTNYRMSQRSTSMIGGRVSAEFGSRVGLDLIWQRAITAVHVAYTDGPGGAPAGESDGDGSVEILMLQPHLRQRFSDEVQAVVAAGPAIARISPDIGYPARPRNGVALSFSLQARLARALTFDARFSNTFVPSRSEPHSHWFLGMGVGWVVNP